MKKLLLKLAIILAAAYSGNVSGQELKWGETLTSDSKVYMPNIFGEDNDFIYVISYERGDIAIEKFDKRTWEKSYSKVIEAKSEEYYEGEGFQDKSEKVLEYVTLLSNQFLVFSSDFDKENNTYSLYTSIYDAKTGEKVEENKKLYEVKVEKLKRRGKWGFLSSKNRKYMLIHHFAYHKKKKMYETHNLIIDKNLEILVDKKETENRDEETYEIYNYIVDNEGSFYYAKRYNAAETYVVSYDVNKDYEKWEEKIVLENMKIGSKLTNVSFSVNSKNDIIISGIYTIENTETKNVSTNDANYAEGCFYIKIENFSKEIQISKLNLFSQEFKNSFRNSKQIKQEKEGKISSLFNITKILNKENGGIIFIGEKYYQVHYNNMTSYVAHFFADLIVLNFSPNGELLWEKRLKKMQGYGSSGMKNVNKINSQLRYFSFTAGLSRNKLYILYNDHPKNVGKEMSKTFEPLFIAHLRTIKDAIVLVNEIDLKSGNIKTSIVDDLKKEKLYLKAMEYYQANQASDMILLGQSKKNYKFGVLSFK